MYEREKERIDPERDPRYGAFFHILPDLDPIEPRL
jgi:hypothetical protein